MNTIPKYLEIGFNTYKTKQISKNVYSVYRLVDLTSLEYIGRWTEQQLRKFQKLGKFK